MTTEREMITDLWVCVDCIMALANGESPDHDGAEQWEKDYEDGINRELPMVWVPEGIHEGEDEEADTNSFSWSPCDLCGSHLGGSRHRAALI